MTITTRPHIVVTRGEQRIVVDPNDFDAFAFEGGDALAIEPQDVARRLITTPEGSKHMLLDDGRAILVPTRVDFFDFKGFRLPAYLIDLTGAGADTFDVIGQAHVNNYKKFMGIPDGSTILEIGCGIGRDALQLIDAQPPIGRYIGIDVTRESILWCRNNIGARHPNFEFHHFNVKHELYNPLGTKTSLDFRLPVESGSVDRVMLGSVFTHMFEDEVIHYMKEIRRALRPGGMAYATFFLYSPEIVAAAVRTNRTPFGLRFEHRHGDGCYISNPNYPTGSVAFTDEAMRRMINAAALRLTRDYLRGWWSGYWEEADDGQEVAILTRNPRVLAFIERLARRFRFGTMTVMHPGQSMPPRGR